MRLSETIPAVFRDAFSFVLVPLPRGGAGGGSGLSLCLGDRGFCADSDPDPGGNILSILILAVSAAGMFSPHPMDS